MLHRSSIAYLFVFLKKKYPIWKKVFFGCYFFEKETLILEGIRDVAVPLILTKKYQN
jgi:hypothetical protein